MSEQDAMGERPIEIPDAAWNALCKTAWATVNEMRGYTKNDFVADMAWAAGEAFDRAAAIRKGQ
jgi:hypothetical protein